MENKHMKRCSTSLALDKSSENIDLDVSPYIKHLRSYYHLIVT